MAQSAPLVMDRQLAALKPGDRPREYRVGGSRGMTLRVFPSGSKQFELRYTTRAGVRRRQVLGAYPDLSLANARTRAAALRLAIADGADPVAEQRQARERIRAGESLNDLAEDYWAAAHVGLHGGRKRPKRAVTIENEKSLWKNHVQSGLGLRRYAELRRADIKTFIRPLVTEKKLSASSVASIGGLVQSVLGYAVLEERLEANPAAGLARPLALTSRERMFDDAGLQVIWQAARAAETPLTEDEIRRNVPRPEPVIGLAIQLLMLTLTRRNEVAGALKSEIDLAARQWTIPTARAKAKHLHVVPLGPECLSVLEKAFALSPDSPHVFASSRVADQPIDAHAITRAFARICSRSDLSLGSPHDVRRSGATTLTGRYGVSRFIVGLILGHTPNDGAAITAVYDRHTYLPEKREALKLWEGHLTGSQVQSVAREDRPELARASAVEREQLKALAQTFLETGDLHQAVLQISMGLARSGEVSASHLDILAAAGMDMARRGAKDEIASWLDGF